MMDSENATNRWGRTSDAYETPTLESSALRALSELTDVVNEVPYFERPAAELVLHLLPYLPDELRAELERIWGDRIKVGHYRIRRCVER